MATSHSAPGGWSKGRIRPWTLAAIALGSFASPAGALFGLEIGGHGGSVSYSGDLFSGSDEYQDNQLSRGAFAGVRLGLTALPVIDVVADLSYTERVSRALDLATEQPLDYDFTHIGLEASARVAIFDPPLSPLSIFAGVGGGLHWIPAIPAEIVVEGGKLSTERVAQPSTFFVGGARFDPPALPLSVFAEGSVGAIFGEGDALRVTKVSAGLLLGL